MLTQTKIPKGYHTVTPYLTVTDAAQQLDFLREAFEGEETFRMAAPDGTVRHAEMRVGDSMLMIGQAGGEWTPRPATLYLYVDDVDAIYRKALAAGATSLSEPKNESYGDRKCGLRDANGNQWWVATHMEDVSMEEYERREKAAKRA
jgi:PhnB protein